MTEEKRTFEELFAELEDIIRRLEAGNLPLAETIALFERSARLAEQCHTLLDTAELRVRQLTETAEGLTVQPVADAQASAP